MNNFLRSALEDQLQLIGADFDPNNLQHIRSVYNWVHARVNVADEKFFCTGMVTDGCCVMVWKNDVGLAILYVFRDGKRIFCSKIDIGKDFSDPTLTDLTKKASKKRVSLVSKYIKKLLMEEPSSQSFSLAMYLFEDFVEGYLKHYSRFDKLLYWCNEFLKRSDVMDAKLHYQLQVRQGEIHEALGQYTQAIVAYTKALKLCKTSDELAQVYNCIGLAHRLAGRCDEAIKFYEKSLEFKYSKRVYSNLCIAIDIKHSRIPEVSVSNYDHKKQLDDNYICRRCFKSGATKVCGSCKSVRYCDRKCQKADWKRHKVECKLCIMKPAQKS